MKKLIRISALIICIFFIADKSKAQIKTAVKPATQQTPVAAKAVAKTSMPDPVAAIKSQGTEVVKPVIIAEVKLPAVSDQGGKLKQ
jgi:hypothetical protein